MDPTNVLSYIPSSDKLVTYVNHPATIIFTLVALIHLIYKFKYAYTKRLFNLNHGPYPWPIIGNMYDLLHLPRDKLFSQWTHKYGKVFPFFICAEPRIAIADCEVIKQICVRDFEYFVDHDFFERFSNKYSEHFLFFAKSSNWKRLRALFSPTFTSSKIKTMYKLIDVCGDDIIDCIYEQIDENDSYQPYKADPNQNETKQVNLELRSTLQLYTLDAITSCCYSMKINRQKGVNTIEAASKSNEFIKMLLNVFVANPFNVLVMFILPKFLHPFIYKDKSYDSLLHVDNNLRPMIESRRRNQTDRKKRFNDYLQILVDAKLDDKLEHTETDDYENHHANVTHDWLLSDQDRNVKDSIHLTTDELNKTSNKTENGISKDKTILSDDEMIGNAVFLLAVGYESTSISIESCIYALAMHQNCQQRLYEELEKIARRRDNGTFEFSYEELTACAYLDSVICEAIRIHSPATGMDRVANKDYKLEKYNVNIPKGTSILFFYQEVHRSPDYWPDPLKFDPERFMPENRHKIISGSYTPFGQGPRYCLGMRFSLTETKLALAKLIMNFKFNAKANSDWPMNLKPGLFGSVEYLNCEVLVQKRARDL